jgi:hypothetical protein
MCGLFAAEITTLLFNRNGLINGLTRSLPTASYYLPDFTATGTRMDFWTYQSIATVIAIVAAATIVWLRASGRERAEVELMLSWASTDRQQLLTQNLDESKVPPTGVEPVT